MRATLLRKIGDKKKSGFLTVSSIAVVSDGNHRRMNEILVYIISNQREKKRTQTHCDSVLQTLIHKTTTMTSTAETTGSTRSIATCFHLPDLIHGLIRGRIFIRKYNPDRTRLCDICVGLLPLVSAIPTRATPPVTIAALPPIPFIGVLGGVSIAQASTRFEIAYAVVAAVFVFLRPLSVREIQGHLTTRRR